MNFPFSKTVRSTTAAALLALALLAPVELIAQREYRPLRHREIAASGAATVYEAVERLRSAWLWTGGDPANPAAAARVLVYVNGTRAGTLDALRGVTAAHVSSVRLVTPDHLRGMDPETATLDIAGAVMVVTDAELARTRPERLRRIDVSVGMGYRGVLERGMTNQFQEAGWGGNEGYSRWHRSDPNPVTVFGSATFNLNPRLSVGAAYHETGDAIVRGYQYQYGTVSNAFSTREFAGLVSARAKLVRVGVGPAYREVEYRQGQGLCACFGKESGTVGNVGAALEATLELPLGRYLSGRVNFSARAFPGQEIPAYENAPALDMGGLTTFSGFSVGFRL